jgi:hypothetical protein
MGLHGLLRDSFEVKGYEYLIVKPLIVSGADFVDIGFRTRSGQWEAPSTLCTIECFYDVI